METQSRRNKILELISTEGKVKVADLSIYFATSSVTIRNDLAYLENEGLLERIHGGAVGTYKSYLSLSFNDRLNVNLNEKERIAETFSNLVIPGDTMIFNAGSTSLMCARKCFEKPGISVVTNSIVIAGEARMNHVERVILLGGMLDGEYQFTYGDDTINHVNKYMADKLIMSVDGISASGGITTHHNSEVESTKAMMQRASYVIVVADGSKIGRTGFASICPVSEIDLLITAFNAPEDDINELKKTGLEVTQA